MAHYRAASYFFPYPFKSHEWQNWARGGGGKLDRVVFYTYLSVGLVAIKGSLKTHIISFAGVHSERLRGQVWGRKEGLAAMAIISSSRLVEGTHLPTYIDCVSIQSLDWKERGGWNGEVVQRRRDWWAEHSVDSLAHHSPLIHTSSSASFPSSFSDPGIQKSEDSIDRSRFVLQPHLIFLAESPSPEDYHRIFLKDWSRREDTKKLI